MSRVAILAIFEELATPFNFNFEKTSLRSVSDSFDLVDLE
jgi:hypothetical protein